MLPLLNARFGRFAAAFGASPDELKFVFSLFLSYPLAALLKRIPGDRPRLKNIFIICVSLFYLVGLFELSEGLKTILASAVGTYCIAKYMRDSPYMPWAGFFFLMAHLSASQLARQFSGTDPAEVDITGAQMVLVMKLTAFCWNVADGALPDASLSGFQRDRKIKELPAMLDYMGYVMFFPSLFAGPAFDFVEYQRWLVTTNPGVPEEAGPAKKTASRQSRLPRSGAMAARKAVIGMAWIGLFVLLGSRFHHTVLLSDSITEYGLLRRIGLVHLVNVTARLKYYGVWTLTGGACVLAGLGHRLKDPSTERLSWDDLQNVDPWQVETAQNSRAFLGGWNTNTNLWLRNYVYLRVTPQGRRPGFRASLLTFVCSALWHGFHPGYYLTFVLASLIQTVAKKFRRQIRPFFLDPISGNPTDKKMYYDAVSWVATQLTFSFTTTPFLILSFSQSVQAWARVYFYGLVGTLISLALFVSPAKGYAQARLDARRERASAKLAVNMLQEGLSGREPVLGVSTDPEQDVLEAVQELKARLGKHR